MAVAPLTIVPVPCACGRQLCGPDRPALRILCDMVDRYDASETHRRVVVRGRHGFLSRNHARKLPAHSTNPEVTRTQPQLCCPENRRRCSQKMMMAKGLNGA